MTVVNFTFGMCGNLKFSTALAQRTLTLHDSPLSPQVPAIYIGDSWNMWRADDFGSKIVSLQQMPRGHEEVFVLSMLELPRLVLISSSDDASVVAGPSYPAYMNRT